MPLIGYIKQVLKAFSKDKVGQLSAAFAYGTIFSIGPLLLVLISIIGFIYGADAAQGKLFTQLSSTVGPETARTIQNVVAHTNQTSKGVVALAIGIVGMLLGAAGITTQLQNSFNTIFGIVPDPKGGIKRTLYVKLKNVSVVLLAGLVVAASLIATALISGLGTHLQDYVAVPAFALELINNLASLGVLIVLLYGVYRIIPDVIVPRKVAWSASAVVSLLFVIGKFVLGFIIGRNGTASAYGAAAALITLLLWIYYSGQILFIGAEGMKIYGENHDIQYEPKKFSLVRTTIHLDGSSRSNRLAQAWLRGLNKNRKA